MILMNKFYQEYCVRKNSKQNAIKLYFLDKLIGLFFKSKPIKISNPKKILIIRNCKIGDMVLTTNVFREIKKNFPNSKLTVIASKLNSQIIEKNPNINKIIQLDFSWRKKPISTLRNYIKVFKKIKREKYDIGIEAGTMLINMIFMYFSKIKMRSGYYSFNGGKPLLTNPVRYKKEIHASISELELVKKNLSIKSINEHQEIFVDENDKLELTNFLNEFKLKKYVCIVPDASFKEKQLSLNKFDAVIKYIKQKYPLYKIILVGSDSKKIRYLSKKNFSTIPLIKKNLRFNYLLYKNSSLVIAPDGAPMHLAWIANINLIALIPKEYNLKHIGPLGKKSIVIYKEMKDISVEDIKTEIDKVL